VIAVYSATAQNGKPGMMRASLPASFSALITSFLSGKPDFVSDLKFPLIWMYFVYCFSKNSTYLHTRFPASICVRVLSVTHMHFG
jgi:hypothetical protein